MGKATYIEFPENPYHLLTPGPLSTSKSVKQVMLRDWCTWDDDYNAIVQNIRNSLVRLAAATESYTSVLLQGSGTYCVEAVITSTIPVDGKLLVIANGVYGLRIAKIAHRLNIPYDILDFGETSMPDLSIIENKLGTDSKLTHVAVVHCETTTGMLNPINTIGELVKQAGKTYIVDAMSSFGGIPINLIPLQADFLISSANKCIQGVPGIGFILAKREEMEQLGGRARSLSLDIFDQWRTMETQGGKWRFTSPTHVVRAFDQALKELEEEGGIEQRYRRYCDNHETLVAGMEHLGFRCLIQKENRSPIITAFHTPEHPGFEFTSFYQRLKSRGFVIYPGKVTDVDTFRIGTIGNIFPPDIQRLIGMVEQSMYWHRS